MTWLRFCPRPSFMDSVRSNATPPQQRQVDEFSLSKVFPFGGMKPCGTEKPGSLCRFGDNLSTALTIYNATLLCYAPSTVIAGTVPVHVSTDGVYFYTAGINFDYHGYYEAFAEERITRFALERTQVGSEYHLRHLRACACGTRVRLVLVVQGLGLILTKGRMLNGSSSRNIAC